MVARESVQFETAFIFVVVVVVFPQNRWKKGRKEGREGGKKKERKKEISNSSRFEAI